MPWIFEKKSLRKLQKILKKKKSAVAGGLNARPNAIRTECLLQLAIAGGRDENWQTKKKLVRRHYHVKIHSSKHTCSGAIAFETKRDENTKIVRINQRQIDEIDWFICWYYYCVLGVYAPVSGHNRVQWICICTVQCEQHKNDRQCDKLRTDWWYNDVAAMHNIMRANGEPSVYEMEKVFDVCKFVLITIVCNQLHELEIEPIFEWNRQEWLIHIIQNWVGTGQCEHFILFTVCSFGIWCFLGFAYQFWKS